MLIYFLLGFLGPLSLTISDKYHTKRPFLELLKINLGFMFEKPSFYDFFWTAIFWLMWPISICIAISSFFVFRVKKDADKFYQDIKDGQLYFDFMEEDPEFQKMKRRILKCK